MKGISINGIKLHEVSMYMRPYHVGASVSLRFPKSRIEYKFEEKVFKLVIPSYLAIELFRSEVLPQKSEEKIEIKESGQKQGTYTLSKIIYSQSSYQDTVEIEFLRKNTFQ